MHLKTSPLPRRPLSSRDTPRQKTPALLAAAWPRRTAGHAMLPPPAERSGAVPRPPASELRLHPSRPRGERGLPKPAAPFAPRLRVLLFLTPTAGPGRANLEADLLPCTFLFFTVHLFKVIGLCFI